MNTVFVDTSGWLAIVHRPDSLHIKAREIYSRLLAAEARFAVHEGILLELGNALSGFKTRDKVIELKENIISSPRIDCISLSTELVDAGWRLFEERPDKEWGRVDCISFVLMKRRNISEALTADKHFEQAGFVKLL